MHEVTLPRQHRGKVRDTYEVPDRDDLLFPVATNRMSTHNVSHLTEFPRKGEYLTALTIFWAEEVLEGIPNHIVAYGRHIWKFVPLEYVPYEAQRSGLIVRKLVMRPVEFVHRNRMAGTLWKYYQAKNDIWGLNLRPGLKLMHEFPLPVFTPTDKSAEDLPIPTEAVIARYPMDVVLTSEITRRMSNHLRSRGIDPIDFKFETGIIHGNEREPILADEFGTSDCCRFARLGSITLGEEPEWLDKEVARQAAIRMWGKGAKVGLAFPPEVVKETMRRYALAFEMITGRSLDTFQHEYGLD